MDAETAPPKEAERTSEAIVSLWVDMMMISCYDDDDDCGGFEFLGMTSIDIMLWFFPDLPLSLESFFKNEGKTGESVRTMLFHHRQLR